MKTLGLVLLSLSISSFAIAEEPKPQGVEGIVKEAKSSRKKKVEMCHDCGKPEVNCDCPEELKAKEAAAKKAAEQGN